MSEYRITCSDVHLCVGPCFYFTSFNKGMIPLLFTIVYELGGPQASVDSAVSVSVSFQEQMTDMYFYV